MATQTRKNQQEDNEMTDSAGRQHDNQGRFVSQEESDSESGRSQSRGGRGNSGNQNNSAQKKAISRAVRVLNEIEARVHELREELEEQAEGKNRSGEESEEHEGSGHRGQVRHPETDGRLKQNRNGSSSRSSDNEDDEEQDNSRSRSNSRR